MESFPYKLLFFLLVYYPLPLGAESFIVRYVEQTICRERKGGVELEESVKLVTLIVEEIVLFKIYETLLPRRQELNMLKLHFRSSIGKLLKFLDQRVTLLPARILSQRAPLNSIRYF